MEGGDILYIVVLIVFLLSGFLKKKKKNAEQETVQPVSAFSGEEGGDFDDWFSDIKKTEKIVPEKLLHKEKTIKTYENTDDTSSLRAQKNIATQLKKSKKSEHAISYSNLNPEINLSTAEEARKAFIYSEIFQRKY